MGCESCHGPGSQYIELHKAIQDASRDCTQAEMLAAGMYQVGPEICAKCHNADSLFVGPDDVFDYEYQKDEGTHEHFPL